MKRSILILCMIIIGCQSKEKQLPASILAKTFYDFDTLEYYKLTASNEEIHTYIQPPMPNQPDAVREENERNRKLYFEGSPDGLNDSIFLNQLAKVEKIKAIIDKKYYNLLKSEVFIQKNCKPNDIAALLPIYTDIFIFKKQNKIVGVLKMGSLNPLHHFIGAKTETQCFGQHGEIEILRKIIDNPLFLKTL